MHTQRPDPTADVRRFLLNLELQILDRELEGRGYYLEWYFDTVDVVDAVLGMMAFHDQSSNSFKQEEFEQPKALVHALAAAGWIRGIHLLPPHQAEFLNLLQLDFGVGLPRKSLALAEQFLASVGVKSDTSNRVPLSGFTDVQLRAYVHDQAGSAERFFKAVQATRGTWVTRLTAMRRDGILDLTPARIEYRAVLESERFQRLKAELDSLRPAFSLNNFADAAALVILADRIDDVRHDRSKWVPRFFASSSTLEDAIDNAGYAKRYTFDLDKQRGSTIFRHADYFVHRAAFYEPHETAPTATAFPFQPDELKRIRDQVALLLREPSSLTAQALEDIRVGDARLPTLMRDLHNYAFLENAWLPFLAENEIRSAVRELKVFDHVTSMMDDRRFREFVNDAIASTRDALIRGTEQYKEVSALWHEFNSRADGLRNRVSKVGLEQLNVFREFGLIRFDYPAGALEEIQRVVSTMLSGDDQAEPRARNKVIGGWLAWTYSEVRDMDAAALISAALWVTRMDRPLIGMLLKCPSTSHYSLQMVLAAALLREKRAQEAESVIRILTETFTQTQNPRLAIGLAYLTFHSWQCLGNRPSWRSEHGTIEGSHQDELALVSKAIEFATHATTNLPPDTPEYAYALNVLLYYMVEGASDDLVTKMQEIASTLARYKDDLLIWQYRFSDTLARFFHRMAKHAALAEVRAASLRKAREWIDEAWAKSFGDPEVASYRAELDVDETRQ